MSGHPDNLWDREALLEKVLELNLDLFSRILDYFIGTPTLITYDYESLPHPRYEAEPYPSGLPQHLEAEYNRLIRQKWLRSQKTFSEANIFIVTHQAFIAQPSRLPLVMQPCPRLNLTGLEKIELNLPTDVYFLMFQVCAPPFPTPDHMHDDGTLLDAGTYLAHCRRLTLTFTTMNPWFDLQSGTWVDGFDEDMQPGNRGDVCTSGLIIDWILTYAWHHGYLQHIGKVELGGDIQEWVKDKWHQVFAKTHPEQDDIASSQRIYEIEHRGEQAALATGQPWILTEHYPPACRCEVACKRLRWGVVEPEMPSTEWENDAQVDLPPVETLPWYNAVETDW